MFELENLYYDLFSFVTLSSPVSVLSPPWRGVGVGQCSAFSSTHFSMDSKTLSNLYFTSRSSNLKTVTPNSFNLLSLFKSFSSFP